VCESLDSAFYTLRGSQLSGYGVDAFDICSLIYKSGFNNLPILIHQDWDGEICGTTARDFIRMSHAPFLMAHQVAKAINTSKPQTNPTIPGTVTGNYGISARAN
jgi:hypothetical protein